MLLAGGADVLIRGAARLGLSLGLSPLVVGLTVVAVGTSAPELGVSVFSAWAGQGDLAVGNVVGSNIGNLLLILGLSALLRPLVVDPAVLRWDFPFLVGVSALLFALAWDGALSSVDGLVCLLLGCVYTWRSIQVGRRQGTETPEGVPRSVGRPRFATVARDLALIGVGLGMLVLGSRWLVDAAVHMARALGVSELVIGLTVVAIGTSLPELFTSIVATMRGQREIVVGNVVGSNIANILLVLGATAVVARGPVRVAPGALALDVPVMLFATVCCYPLLLTGGAVSRKEGALLMSGYFVYVVHLALTAARHAWAPGFARVALFAFVPVACLVAVGASVSAWRAGRFRART